MDERIFDFFKTFADANRLRLAGMLLERPLSAEEIAARLKIKVSDVPRQIAQLEKLELVTLDGDRYHMDPKALERLSREVLSGARPETRSNDENADDFDRKIVKNYSLPDGRLREIPTQEKKILPILKHVVQVFTPGTRYTEKEVNELLKRFNADYASLRRYLVDYKLLQREQNGTVYWREE